MGSYKDLFVLGTHVGKRMDRMEMYDQDYARGLVLEFPGLFAGVYRVFANFWASPILSVRETGSTSNQPTGETGATFFSRDLNPQGPHQTK